jgi:hypothetical protein
MAPRAEVFCFVTDALCRLNSKSFITQKRFGWSCRVVGFDAVGREVLAGPLEELPKRIVIAGTRELKKLGTSVFVGAQTHPRFLLWKALIQLFFLNISMNWQNFTV